MELGLTDQKQTFANVLPIIELLIVFHSTSKKDLTKKRKKVSLNP